MHHLETEAEKMLETMDSVVQGLNSLYSKALTESLLTTGATRQQYNEIIDVLQDTLRSHRHAGDLIQKLRRMLEVKN